MTASTALREAADEGRPHDPLLYYAAQRLALGLADTTDRAVATAIAAAAEGIARGRDAEDAIPVTQLSYWQAVATSLADALDLLAAADSVGAGLQLTLLLQLLETTERPN